MIAGESVTPPLRPFNDIPRLNGTFITGNLAEFSNDALATLIRARREFGDLVRLRLGPMHYLLVSHPEAVNRILTGNQKNYAKTTKGYQTLEPMLGQGLLTSNGDYWLKQRRTVQPAFHRDRIHGFAQIMVDVAEQMIAGWDDDVEAGNRIDLNHEMMHVTLRVIGLTMLSMDFNDEAAVEIGEAVTTCLKRSDELVTQPVGAGELPTEANREYLAAIDLLNQVIVGVIGERRRLTDRGEAAPEDLLGMLLAARDPETDEAMTDKQLRDEVMTIFLAGHETTANALTFTFRLLAEHPDLRERLHAELDAAGEAPFGLDDLEKLPFTKQCIEESLRLYPSIWLIGRQAVEDDVLIGHQIPAGTHIFVCPWLLHHHTDFWDEPERFDPDRFAEGGSATDLQKGLYIPFTEGPRQCIGKAFAMMEAQLLLANICRRFQFDLEENQRMELEPGITLRPAYGLKLIPTRR